MALDTEQRPGARTQASPSTLRDRRPVKQWMKHTRHRVTEKRTERFDGLAGGAGQRMEDTSPMKTSRTSNETATRFRGARVLHTRRFAPPVESVGSAVGFPLCLGPLWPSFVLK